MHRPDRLVISGSVTPAGHPRRKGTAPGRLSSGGPSQQRRQQQNDLVDSPQALSSATTTTVSSRTVSSLCPFQFGAMPTVLDPSHGNAVSAGTQSSSPLLPQGRQATAPSGSHVLSVLEGPLPAEIREIIHSQCSGEPAEVAERHARRLLSTHRRVRVYREELQSAVEEVGDVAQMLQRHQTVQDALRVELKDLDAQIERLVRERQLCELQLSQEDEARQRDEVKLRDAKERVNVLRSTIDTITQESLAGYVVLRQLVPNLNVENYVA
ncbi:hypothetical protein C3747_250g41 [Trypanosoma cruzi]|uniref:Uncharacterized protein n=2 Tax=Trypanosoma cruzi TaxID=5693 RepID=Q4DHT3_TRYCC|nr:hypothetical protein, conserved [Trypanosoma cruzi]EAN92088.1 hypothetical protein, conserved [Trypanosoma cruzi]PWU96842.1 hypothetical protein C3747_250g41 [Trypanosoma cruzi]RNC37606.1 hypothetical protein TcCL_NonESM13223 [Trypanosoma cruzi]|eukprot:XP_813939.1 hypothetical protein [Trypanosoma cruzi strain CL Brener]